MQSVKTVYCLYRVSTDKQVDYSKDEADIPVQRDACHSFSMKMLDWEIKKEFLEDGISGSKVSANDRDAIQELKLAAVNKEFNVLLVFMFDRLGRISSETPFIVEWFVKQGIEVWSVNEGQQKFDTHMDSLTNYMRYWQAEGESTKISIRSSAGMADLIRNGHWKGGISPYGYKLVKTGRTNKRGNEVSDLAIEECEATVVRLIFNKYVNEGYGSWRLTQWLNKNGYLTRKGTPWSSASIKNILKNIIYTGILKSGGVQSDKLQDLVIVDDDTFEMAQAYSTKRVTKKGESLSLNIKGKTLLNGLVYCGDCGSKLVLSTSGSYNKRKDGSRNKTPRIRYNCYGKTRHLTDCTGQTGYSASILDPIVDSMVKQLLEKSKTIPHELVLDQTINQKLKDLETTLSKAEYDLKKESDELSILKQEVVKSLKGSSTYTPELLAGLINDKEKNIAIIEKRIQDTNQRIKMQDAVAKDVIYQFKNLLTWADVYDTANIQTKKTIIFHLIKRIEVKRGYELAVDFNINFPQFELGIDFK